MSIRAAALVDELRRRIPRSNATLSVGNSPINLAPELASATHDSRVVAAAAKSAGGVLFCCVPGLRIDGHRYGPAAADDGAAALLVDHVLDVGIDQVVVADVREAMGFAASIVHGDPARSFRMVGITGTNGKTTTAHMLEAVLLASGRRPAVLGTLTQVRTTPEATELQASLAQFRDEGRTDVIMEVTSHALDLHRVNGCHFVAALFTNLSQDHLDYHGTMERYFRAKAKLFVPEFTDRAVVNRDDLYGRLLNDAALVPTQTISIDDVRELRLSPSGSSFRWGDLMLSIKLAGEFNVRNALGAAAVARGLGVDDAAIASGLADAVVPGRYEPVQAGQSFAVIVDFAHTPDGLLSVLHAARASLPPHGRLIVVFGCGGDRDRGKRPQMGSIAAMYADAVIVTSDNPRSEDPQLIINEILGGIDDRENVSAVVDRHDAIELAIANARPSDIVLIAGKGHESGQDVGGVVTPFDDRVVARNILVETIRSHE